VMWICVVVCAEWLGIRHALLITRGPPPYRGLYPSGHPSIARPSIAVAQRGTVASAAAMQNPRRRGRRGRVSLAQRERERAGNNCMQAKAGVRLPVEQRVHVQRKEMQAFLEEARSLVGFAQRLRGVGMPNG
jgi:hypothetical protein